MIDQRLLEQLADAVPFAFRLAVYAFGLAIVALALAAWLALRDSEPPAEVVCPEPLPLSWYAPGGLDTGRVPVPSRPAP